MTGKLAIVTGAFVLLLTSAARAETFCVDDAPACAGVPQATLPLALAAADALAGEDRIVLGPRTYAGPFDADGDNDVELVGAGRGSTVLTAAGDTETALSLAAPGASVSALTVRLGAGNGMTGISAATAADVAIEGGGNGALGFAGGSFMRGSVDLGTGATAVRLTGAGALLENVTVRTSDVGVEVASDAGATLRSVTLAGAGGGTGVDVIPGGAATVSSSLITGFATAIRTAPLCITPCAVTDYSAYDPALVGGVVTVADATPAPVSGDPRLRDDLRPRFDSPLVDAANPAASGDADASGAARVVDGDGAGGARGDIGALEYQRRAPVITAATATPGSAAVGVPIAFHAAASDADDEAVSAVWAFGDGATATGFDVTHAFSAPGAWVAELTVTDAAGATARTSVTTTIGAAAAPSPKPPRATARVLPDAVKLRAVARRDRRPPYRFKLRGRVVLPRGVSAAGCAGGRIALAVRAGKRRLSRRATLKPDCSFRLTLKLGRKRAKRVIVTPHFSGTAALAPRDGVALRLRAG